MNSRTITFPNIHVLASRVTGRAESLLAGDIARHHKVLAERITGTSVLVIGAGGTIGSEFIKSLLPFHPAKIVAVDLSENYLTELVRDVRSTPLLLPPKEFLTYPINFADPVFERLLAAEGPFDIVANFAAHKHVRSEKDMNSIEAMFENNVFRARRLLDQLRVSRPRHFFCVSTDKAANPANLMGASKKLMEDLVMAYADELPVTTARFANVAYSHGSLLEGFVHRLMRQQPLSAPDDVQRYFVTPQESGQLCMMACVLGSTGEIFFPRLDRSHDLRRFSDIAVDLLTQMGLAPDILSSESAAREAAVRWDGGSSRYPVYFFRSDTTGEKGEEEFHTAGEEVDLSRFAALGVIRAGTKLDRASVLDGVDKLSQYVSGADRNKARFVELLREVVPTLQHVETGKNLDQRM